MQYKEESEETNFIGGSSDVFGCAQEVLWIKRVFRRTLNDNEKIQVFSVYGILKHGKLFATNSNLGQIPSHRTSLVSFELADATHLSFHSLQQRHFYISKIATE
jgi:hypothetical protein